MLEAIQVPVNQPKPMSLAECSSQASASLSQGLAGNGSYFLWSLERR